MESIWSQTCLIRQREALPGDIKTDIAVIGAGMAGILISSALQTAGRRVVVLEAERIASGQTRNTTAKITCQHGLLYEKLTRTLGREKARQYAQANAAALEEYRRIITTQNIDCDLEQRDAYVYGSNAAQLRKEAEAARELPPGHGGVVFWKGKKLGVYKDESGALWPVDIRCPHLGCQLEWNPDEHSWDCPCHGSRFDYRGHLLSGPAQEDLNHK